MQHRDERGEGLPVDVECIVLRCAMRDLIWCDGGLSAIEGTCTLWRDITRAQRQSARNDELNLDFVSNLVNEYMLQPRI